MFISLLLGKIYNQHLSLNGFVLYLNLIGQINFNLIPFFVLSCFLNRIGHSCKKAKNVMIKNLNHLHMQSYGQTLGNTLKFLDHKHDKDDGNFSGSGKRISITMTTAWRCAPCQQMRRIQINQWSGSWACNLHAKIEFIRCGWLRWREWVVLAWTLRGRSCGRYASRRESGNIRQLSLQLKFLPSFRERCSPPNPESASIGRNLGWRNSNSIEILFYCNSIIGCHIATKFCMTCAKFHGDHSSITWMRAEWNFHSLY